MNTSQIGFINWALWIVIGVTAALAWYYRYDDLAHALSVIWGIGLFYLLNLILQAKVPSNIQKYLLGFIVAVTFLVVFLATRNLTR